MNEFVNNEVARIEYVGGFLGRIIPALECMDGEGYGLVHAYYTPPFSEDTQWVDRGLVRQEMDLGTLDTSFRFKFSSS